MLPRKSCLLLMITALSAAPSTLSAQSALVTVEGAGAVPLGAPQSDRFGFGAAATVGGYIRLAPFILLGARLRGGLLSDGAAPRDPGLNDPGVGSFETLSAMVRVRPLADAGDVRNGRGLFVEAGAGGVVTGDLVRAGIEAGVGYGFALRAFSISPTLRYLQVLQPRDVLSDDDAHVLLFGAEFALLDASPRVVPKAVAAVVVPQDRDHDGFVDDKDACPTDAEDFDRHDDEDGCPESDNDGDKILDAKDACPNAAEDFDAFEDDDGCPEPDNDHDTFLDADDECPTDAEVVNGNADYDGCPDEGLIEMINDRIVLEERVLFDFEKARVRSAAHPVLEAIVSLYKLHPEWAKIRIEGHADARGDAAFNQDVSERRAAMVRNELVKRGIPATIIESVGLGATRPRDKRKVEEAYRLNRRVEFVVVSSSNSASRPAKLNASAVGAEAVAPGAPAQQPEKQAAVVTPPAEAAPTTEPNKAGTP